MPRVPCCLCFSFLKSSSQYLPSAQLVCLFWNHIYKMIWKQLYNCSNILVLGTIAFSFLLLPLCQYVLRPIGNPNCKYVLAYSCFSSADWVLEKIGILIKGYHYMFRISFGSCGRFTQAELLSLFCSLFLVMVWMMTGHWILMDGLLHL